MNILITGGTGFIGRHLCRYLITKQHNVTVVSRDPQNLKNHLKPYFKGVQVISWNEDFPEADVAIHLAGTLVDSKRWSPKFIEEATQSRTKTAEALKAKLTDRCKLVITASGANCYPFGEVHDESGPYGDSVSAQIVKKWEGVWSDQSVRFVAMRIGFVIGKGCAGLQKMLPIYKAGLGGVIGSGDQRMSWVGIEDLVRAFELVIENEQIGGPVNAVAPEPMTFKEFNDALGKAAKMPAFWRIPGWVMRLMYGKMADELILADYPVIPKVLADAGFEWEQADIEEALRAIFIQSPG